MRLIFALKKILFIACLLTSLFAASEPGQCARFYGQRQTTFKFAKGAASFREAKQISDYLLDTVSSLETLRGKNGIVADASWVQAQKNAPATIRILNENTSPSNIAVDLLVHTEIVLRGIQINDSAKTLSRALDTLSLLKRHVPTGLFFGWYSTKIEGDVMVQNLSSIENIHLALALWTIKESFPNSSMGKQAKTLFESMDFSIFYEERTGLIGGNFRYIQGQWVRDKYNFDYLGSEARILYSVGWALGVFKKYGGSTDFVKKALENIVFEKTESGNGSLLKLWDGSAFQLLFPKIFAGEEQDSPVLKKMHATLGQHMVSEGARRGLSVPASHSPGVNKIITLNENSAIALYNDKAGNKNLVSAFNKDLDYPPFNRNWDQTFTPYALFMAATANPSLLLPLLENLKKIKSGDDNLYLPGLGWMDGYNISGDFNEQVVPAQLAINQGMIGLSLLQLGSTDGLSASGRALHNHSEVNDRLKYFYNLLDQKISAQDVK